MAKLPGADPLLILATILLAGMALGWLATRLRLPSVTGQIVAGVAIGRAGFELFEYEAVNALQPITHLALAWIAATVGAHLNLRRLRNAGTRLGLLFVSEALVTPLIVGAALLALTLVVPGVAALLGALAISTAPATVLAIVRESRAWGVFVKTLMAGVALNGIACILLFEAARAIGRLTLQAGPGFALDVVVDPLLALARAVGLGVAIAVASVLVTARVVRPGGLATIGIITLLLAFGVATWLDVSPLLTCLVLGIVQTNLMPAREAMVDQIFGDFEPAILCIFFTLAGMHLSLDHAGEAGVVAAVFFAARILGKLVAGRLAMEAAGVPDRVRKNLGLALIPQAGVAVGLVLLIQDDPAFASVEQLLTAVVLTSVAASEIVGPVLTRIALGRSGEVGRDRPRLVDFLQEENIVTGLRAGTKEEAIGQLTDLLVRSHRLSVDRDALLRSVLEREAQVSTCLGGGLAVPHGELPEGLPMVGVMGVSREGLHFETPDDRPVHCMVLLATPRGERDRHLEVLAALARTLGSDPNIQQQLYSATTPAHAYEILHGEETEDFNYFLEEET
jgi:mannitol/fructose-specific phosphotransferase system IIA component (Ntr-type)